MRARLSGLYVITDPALLPQERLVSGVESALRGGAKIVQYRDKLATETERLSTALSLKSLCHDFDASFIVNDDLTLCQRVGADGVHLGKQDGDVELARNTLNEDQILGVTCHNDWQYANRMVELGVDYCAYGRIFPSKTKPDAPACSLRELASLVSVPCATVAIGGITLDNAQQVLDSGADMLAVIHGVFGQTNIEMASRSLSSLFI